MSITGYLTVQRNLMYYNVKDFGAQGDWITDDTAAISAARAIARVKGGIVFYPPGGYVSDNQDFSLDANVYHVGSGEGVTIIQLKNGVNSDLFSAQTALIDPTGAQSSTGTLYNFGFFDMTLDGNKANQSGGPSYPLRFYGYAFTLKNLEVRNGYSGNIVSAGHPSGWQATASNGCESRWENVKTHQSGGNGITYYGPSDSQFINVIPYEEGLSCWYMGANSGGCTLVNCHPWASQQRNPSTVYGNDSFVRANQSGFGAGTDTQTWGLTQISGVTTLAIVSNKGQVTGTGSYGAAIYGSKTAGDIDETIRLNKSDAGSDAGFVFHWSNANNFYKVFVESGTLYVTKIVSGAASTLASAGVSDTAGVAHRLHVQYVNGFIRANYYLDGAAEPGGWQVNVSDSSLAAGNYGLIFYVNSGSILYDSFSAIAPSSGCPPFLIEANNVHFINCTADTAPQGVAGVVVLGTGITWDGGWIENASNIPASGFQVGQQAGQPVFPGTQAQSGGYSTNVAVSGCRINTFLQDAYGGNGALYLANDAGHNKIDVTCNQASGSVYTGTLHSTTELHAITAGAFVGNDVHQYATMFHNGTGAPSNSLGNNGDYFFRTDTPGTANQRLYVKSAGAWVAIL